MYAQPGQPGQPMQPYGQPMHGQPMQPYGQPMAPAPMYGAQPMQPMAHGGQMTMGSTMGAPAYKPVNDLAGLPPQGPPQAQDPEFPLKKISTNTKIGQNVQCGSCKQKVTTGVEKKFSTTGWLFVGAMIYICCPLFWLPFLMDMSYQFIHTCPHCKANLSFNL